LTLRKMRTYNPAPRAQRDTGPLRKLPASSGLLTSRAILRRRPLRYCASRNRIPACRAGRPPTHSLAATRTLPSHHRGVGSSRLWSHWRSRCPR
jgi:hypothetical protein